MCRSVAIAPPLELAPGQARMGRIVLSGLAVALVGLTAFGLAHALIIIPIWTRLLGGIPFAIAAGIALAWAFDALVQHRGSQTIGSGVQFGAVMYLTLLPATALEAAMRWAGLRTLDWTEVIPAVILALLSGFVAGWRVTRRRDAAIAFSVAALALTLVSAGPLPVAQSIRGAWLSLAIALICLVAGAALSSLHSVLVLAPRSGARGSSRSVSALRQAQGAPSDPLRSESRGGGQGPPE
jgi:hypothetical protein